MVTACRAGEVYIVDFDALSEGSQGIAGRHPVVVLSPRFLNVQRDIVNAVPLLGIRPRGASLHVVPLEKEYYWSEGGAKLWAQCDRLLSLPLERLEPADHEAARRRGINHIPVPVLAKSDLERVRLGVVHVIDAQNLLQAQARKGFKAYIDRVRRALSSRKKRASQRRA